MFPIMSCCRYGKLSYFLTLAPYVIITTLLAYTATLEGFMDGVNYYLTPEWSKLGDLEVCPISCLIVYNVTTSDDFFSLSGME